MHTCLSLQKEEMHLENPKNVIRSLRHKFKRWEGPKTTLLEISNCKHNAVLMLARGFRPINMRLIMWTSFMVQWLRLHTFNAWGPGSIPTWGTGPHMLQVKILHATTKNLSATTKTQRSQINNFLNEFDEGALRRSQDSEARDLRSPSTRSSV